MMKLLTLGACLVLLTCAAAWSQTDPPPDTTGGQAVILAPPAPVGNLEATDVDNDHGHAITLRWEKSGDDGAGRKSVDRYQIFRWFPDEMRLADSLRGALSNVQSTVRAFRSDIPRAEHALKALTEDPSRLASLRFQVAVPPGVTAMARDPERIAAALRDTIATMRELLPVLKSRVRPLISEFNAVMEQLPAAHRRYPDRGEWQKIGWTKAGFTEFTNTGSKDKTARDYYPDHTDLYYRVEAVTADSTVRSEAVQVGPVESRGQWYHTGKTPVLVFVLVFCCLTVVFVSMARKGAELYVRPLSGIEAVDDAIGRATEMGRPILYLLGLGTADMVSTIASFNVLARVAKRVAEYQTPVIVPCYDAIVMAVAQEVVKSSYLDAGRPDDYKQDSVFFVTNYQFAYVAAVNGIMLRERPATNIYMGKFFAESLLLAETGSLAGSIQIAGTDEIAQIPFFIVACDYTLIGEELYAASAYLGREPILLGSLKAQDWAKVAVMILALAGMVGTAVGWTALAEALEVVG